MKTRYCPDCWRNVLVESQLIDNGDFGIVCTFCGYVFEYTEETRQRLIDEGRIIVDEFQEDDMIRRWKRFKSELDIIESL